MSVVTDYPDSAPHVATANQIAATGVPLLNLFNEVGLNSENIAAGSSLTFFTETVTQPGYEIYMNGSTESAATVPFAQVSVTWSDPVSGVVVAVDTYMVPLVSTGNGIPMMARGVSKGNRCQIVVKNLDPAQQAQFIVGLWQSSRIFSRDSFTTINASIASGTVVPTFTLATVVNDSKFLGILEGVTVPATETNTYLFGAAAGQEITIAGTLTGIAATSVSLAAYPAPSSVYSGSALLLAEALTTADFEFTFVAPSAPIRLNVINGATTGTLTFSCTMLAQG